MKFARVLLNIQGITGIIISLALRHNWPLFFIDLHLTPDSLLEFSFAGIILAFCFQAKYTIIWRVMALLMVALIVCEGMLLLK